jgi:hypothetical protein
MLSHFFSSFLFFRFSAFAGQFQFDPQTAPARLFTFSMAFWALLIGATYTGELNLSRDVVIADLFSRGILEKRYSF